jgi:lipoprotein-anchoring transpeptidase ErfK/SrfK
MGTEKQEKQSIGWITGTLLIGLPLVVGAGVYGLMLYRGTFGQVSVANVDVQRQVPTQQLESGIRQQLSAFGFSIAHSDGKTTSYTAHDAGIDFDISKTVQIALAKKASNKLPDGLEWWRQEAIPIELTIDEGKLQTFIAEKTAEVTEAPTNATLTVDAGNVQMTAEKTGKGYGLVNAHDVLIASAKQGKSQTFTLTPQVVNAPVTMHDIAPLKTQVESALQQTLTFTIAGRSFQPDKTTIGGWVAPIDLAAKRANLEYNSGQIQAYIDSIAKPYVSLPRSQVTMTNPDGATIVLIPGHNGTDVKNKQDISTDVAKKLLSSQPIEENLTVDDATYGSVAAQAYDKWLVVDLTNKRMDAYEKSTLVRSVRISAGAPATPTVLGQFAIYAKAKSQDMQGQNADGSSYFQPAVKWVNYFYGSYAIHGNYWRPNSWFGNINSSHGCVGIRDIDGEWIYNWAPIGTPVITHV